MSNKTFDVVMIGAGPSALTAAIYTTREDMSTVLYEKAVVGGMAAITDKIDNYPGFPEGIEGFALAGQMENQAKRFGAQIEFGDVKLIRDDGDRKIITVDDDEVIAKAVLIATGSSHNKLGIPGEQEYYGRGVHYCATCDGAFYRGKQLAVVGGANSAVQEAIFLTRFAKHINLLVRSTIKASEVLQNELQKYIDQGKITVHLGTSTDEIMANDSCICAVKTTKGGSSVDIKTDGVFIFAGLKPNTSFLDGSGVELDEQGFIVTDSRMETSVPGIFASGDVRSGAVMQVASAAGEGAVAAVSIREYLNGRA